jgi:hypothetical protein
VACQSGVGINWYLIDSLSGASPNYQLSPNYQFSFGNSTVCEPVTGDSATTAALPSGRRAEAAAAASPEI